jgi:anionic cell wall polymer biosynthesis LytR-Cps2A-Psr (LCP) family protein
LHPTGDLSRIRRDHEFLRVMTSAVQRKGLGNPLTLNAVVGDVAPQLTIDNNLSFNTLVSLVRRYRSIDPNSIPELTLPAINAPGGHPPKPWRRAL